MAENKNIEDLSKLLENLKDVLPQVSAILDTMNNGIITDFKKTTELLKRVLSKRQLDIEDIKELLTDNESKKLDAEYIADVVETLNRFRKHLK